MTVNMKNALQKEINIVDLLQPETKLEKQLLEDEEFRKGLFWGKPRFGHPEGMVVFHIKEVLDNIQLLEIPDKMREQLRLITYAHDTFKCAEEKIGKGPNRSNHHSILARKYMENFISDQSVLDVIEYHDEAYYCWRLQHLYNRMEEGTVRMNEMLHKLKGNMQLFYLFFKCDTKTGDKIQAPLHWFENTVGSIEVVDF
jgi:hypothetical protein